MSLPMRGLKKGDAPPPRRVVDDSDSDDSSSGSDSEAEVESPLNAGSEALDAEEEVGDDIDAEVAEVGASAAASASSSEPLKLRAGVLLDTTKKVIIGPEAVAAQLAAATPTPNRVVVTQVYRMSLAGKLAAHKAGDSLTFVAAAPLDVILAARPEFKNKAAALISSSIKAVDNQLPVTAYISASKAAKSARPVQTEHSPDGSAHGHAAIAASTAVESKLVAVGDHRMCNREAEEAMRNTVHSISEGVAEVRAMEGTTSTEFNQAHVRIGSPMHSLIVGNAQKLGLSMDVVNPKADQEGKGPRYITVQRSVVESLRKRFSDVKNSIPVAVGNAIDMQVTFDEAEIKSAAKNLATLAPLDPHLTFKVEHTFRTYDTTPKPIAGKKS